MCLTRFGCDVGYYCDPHVDVCVPCSYLCHPAYETEQECKQFCPEYNKYRHVTEPTAATTLSLDIQDAHHVIHTDILLYMGIPVILVTVVAVLVYKRVLLKRNGVSQPTLHSQIEPDHEAVQTECQPVLSRAGIAYMLNDNIPTLENCERSTTKRRESHYNDNTPKPSLTEDEKLMRFQDLRPNNKSEYLLSSGRKNVLDTANFKGTMHRMSDSIPPGYNTELTARRSSVSISNTNSLEQHEHTARTKTYQTTYVQTGACNQVGSLSGIPPTAGELQIVRSSRCSSAPRHCLSMYQSTTFDSNSNASESGVTTPHTHQLMDQAIFTNQSSERHEDSGHLTPDPQHDRATGAVTDHCFSCRMDCGEQSDRQVASLAIRSRHEMSSRASGGGSPSNSYSLHSDDPDPPNIYWPRNDDCCPNTQRTHIENPLVQAIHRLPCVAFASMIVDTLHVVVRQSEEAMSIAEQNEIVRITQHVDRHLRPQRINFHSNNQALQERLNVLHNIL